MTKPFVYNIGKYYGEFTPGNLVFNANLQEFAQQVSYLCTLAANGEMTVQDVYQEIEKSWQQLKLSKKELLDKTKFTTED
ncbi:MAG: hypothetical protein QNJ41_29680 [Xenococcaceae cyanobacterium MO_188.B32]|nr:hypothetical protein [Xenococcaceae cyanobacterium MO_188.B32]